MASKSPSNNGFSERDELLAGQVLGNLSADERRAITDNPSWIADDQGLLDALQSASHRMEQLSAPPLSDAVKERLLRSARRPRLSNSQNWLIGGLLMVLAVTGGELYRSKLQIASLNSQTPSIALQPGDRVVALHATQSGWMQQARGEVLIRPAQGSNLLTLNQLPQAPEGQLYRLWAVTPQGLKGCVHFLPDQGGHVLMTIPAQPTGSATKLFVSLDPMSSRDDANYKSVNPVLSGAI